MSVFQIKGEILDLVSQVNEQPIAEKLLELVKNYVSENVGKEAVAVTDKEEETMTSEEEVAIRRAIARSHNRHNFISSKEAEQKLSRWLKT